MENNVNKETVQLEYMEAKRELLEKAGILGICTAVFFAMLKLLTDDASIFICLRDGFYFSLVMYLPFKICYQTTGSIIGSLIGSFVLVIIVGLILGDGSTMLGWILFGGMALDLGRSIYRMWTLRKLLHDEQ